MLLLGCCGAPQLLQSGGTQVHTWFSLQTVEHGFPHQPSALGYSPSLRLLAIGTRSGAIKLYPSGTLGWVLIPRASGMEGVWRRLSFLSPPSAMASFRSRLVGWDTSWSLLICPLGKRGALTGGSFSLSIQGCCVVSPPYMASLLTYCCKFLLHGRQAEESVNLADLLCGG